MESKMTRNVSIQTYLPRHVAAWVQDEASRAKQCQSAYKRDPLSARKRDPLSGWRSVDVTGFLALRAA